MAAASRLYELINMSDKYTFRARDDLAAAAAGIIVGEGGFGVETEDGKTALSIMLFAGAKQAEEYLVKLFGEGSLGGWLDRPGNLLAAAEALDSVMIMDMRERRTYEEALVRMPDEATRASYRDALHDKNRTSLNDIGKRAWSQAKMLRKKAAEKGSDGQQAEPAP